MIRVCMCCKELRDIAYVDPLDRGYCSDCVVSSAVPIGSVARAMGLASSTVRFKVGDQVGAFGAGGELYDGVGTVVGIDLDVRHGNPAMPAYQVRVDHPTDEDVSPEGCYLEPCLTPVAAQGMTS